MNETTLSKICATFEASNQGTIHFGQVISQLVEAGVESYYVDYRSGRTTYYLPDGSTADFSFERPQHRIADAFDGDAVRAAILGAQQGKVMYPEFKTLSQRAGCVAYTVWIAGRHVVYLGRRGETHIERFPG
ncbi:MULTISPECIES: DUF1398 domain-containing protein [unclassified Thiomonas]|jgi:uncharacterized protein YbcV (DUF1398 family)|uniref:DUF1398 domain-containing protein n=1 Tax=unclassified Thiomonas TaxID=2625466 RepID=UPI0004DBA8A4|nr:MULTISPECIES: DUF1398 family protein [unclassified Thiomonas]MDE2175329.1 DUF1398 family protein [Betaproteobacteria bacterium]CDW94827.1 conserved hypothetical protein [Thiomonas sp. CB2]VDY04075.1 conserved protein of unknown function [Thiomonas sp. Bio17B3]VDY08753.1 conserved protein of unknown function [Thiomonas sp. Sup16B3]VDY12322.1 conserved protein of unknown function [Thiomonas sp. OC7]